MPSPFPGMNPYIERDIVWHDFHQRFMVALADAIGARVRPAYFVRVDEHVYIRELPGDPFRSLGRPDAWVARSDPGDADPVAAVIDAPAEVTLMPTVDEETVPFLEVIERTTRQVVTVIELLSPSNKSIESDRELYLAKRRRVLRSAAALVELDLLRGGPRMPIVDPIECDYYALVSRPGGRPRAGFWPIRLRDPLPELPIPLRPGEPEPRVALQPILHRVYDAAAYELTIYDGDPEPPLSADAAGWARSLITPTAP